MTLVKLIGCKVKVQLINIVNIEYTLDHGYLIARKHFHLFVLEYILVESHRKYKPTFLKEEAI